MKPSFAHLRRFLYVTACASALCASAMAQDPAAADNGFMPAFGGALADGQIVELAGYMRARFAPDKAPWSGLEAAVQRVRATPSAH